MLFLYENFFITTYFYRLCFLLCWRFFFFFCFLYSLCLFRVSFPFSFFLGVLVSVFFVTGFSQVSFLPWLCLHIWGRHWNVVGSSPLWKACRLVVFCCRVIRQRPILLQTSPLVSIYRSCLQFYSHLFKRIFKLLHLLADEWWWW